MDGQSTSISPTQEALEKKKRSYHATGQVSHWSRHTNIYLYNQDDMIIFRHIILISFISLESFVAGFLDQPERNDLIFIVQHITHKTVFGHVFNRLVLSRRRIIGHIR